MTVLVIPEAQRALKDSPALYEFLTRLRRRFTPLSNLSLVVLIFTGLIQMTGNPNYAGVLQITNEWTRVILLKHIAVGGMLLCGVAMQFWLMPALERTSLLVERGKGDPDAVDALRRREARLTWVNVILAIMVLGFTAWARSL
jgi:putative copper export protein